MSSFAPVIILILAMLIQGSLQLSPAVFSIFYHSALGKLSSKKVDDLSLNFILGVEVYFTIVLLSITAITNLGITNIIYYPILFWTFSGIFFVEAIIALFFYYRKSSATALFIPRSAAKGYNYHIAKIKTRRDAFVLGFFSNLPELIFTLPLFILIALVSSIIPSLSSFLVIIPYILIAIVPLFSIRTLFRTDHNLAFITRLRTKLKPYFRLILFFSYLIIAIILIYLGINYGQ